MVQQVVKPENLNLEFDIGTITGNKISLKIDGTLTKAADGTIGLNGGAITVVSGDTGNIIRSDAANGALLTQADIQAVESVWSANDPDGFLTSTAAGSNGHTVTHTFNWSNPEFIERVQDAVGAALGADINYDDALNLITTNLGNIAFGDGLNLDTAGNVVDVKPDTASPSTVTVSPAGVHVTANVSADAGNLATLGADNKIMVDTATVTALASEELQDAFGVKFGTIFP